MQFGKGSVVIGSCSCIYLLVIERSLDPGYRHYATDGLFEHDFSSDIMLSSRELFLKHDFLHSVSSKI